MPSTDCMQIDSSPIKFSMYSRVKDFFKKKNNGIKKWCFLGSKKWATSSGERGAKKTP